MARSWGVVTGILGLLVSCVVGLMPATAGNKTAGGDSTTLSLAGRTIQLEPARFESGLETDSISFRISGPDPQSIEVEVLDLVVDSKGSKSVLPLGSSPHTLEGVVSLGPHKKKYVPNGSTQSFSVDVTAKASGDEVRYGGVRIGMTPKNAAKSGGSLSSSPGVFLTLLVVPEGFSGELPNLGDTEINSSGISIRPLFPENIFEILLPDLPGILNRGPVAISADISNQSNNPVFIGSNWLVKSSSEVLLSKSTERTLVFAGQSVNQEVELVATGPGSTRPVDLLSLFDFVEVEMTNDAQLGSNVLASNKESISFLVIRWKEPVGLLICLLVVAALLARSRRPRSNEVRETIATRENENPVSIPTANPHPATKTYPENF